MWSELWYCKGAKSSYYWFGIEVKFLKNKFKYLLIIKIVLNYRMKDGEFEQLEIAPYSSPPELPYVMKNQETNGQEPPM